MNVSAGLKIQQAISFAVAGLAASSMPAPLERDAVRDEALRKMAAVAGERGWRMATLRDVAGPEADLLFPGGPVEMVESWSDLCDRDMLSAMLSCEEKRLSQRVKQALLLRLPVDRAMRTGARSGFGVLAAPCAGGALRRSMLRTVNAIWQAAQDDSSGVTYVTKRLTLGSVYAATLLFWLARGQNEADMARFVEHRLAGVLRIGKLKTRLLGVFMRPEPSSVHTATSAEAA
ncbi:ubiquinone biosynthesis protein COQ9 [Acetobacter cibinongensis]|uniref:RpsU-divergently transcribed protein n=1 Tax=Acetobacter cibinongensis TaxID=146475 RepID=A0A1Z5YU31_9PROT|nr:rpsU-divergently transcribed protein [Acetobacter cibinongensis]OUJ02005.1 rpsU-divergently transcribed protein [Acetobacter cibinongensis]